MKPEYVFLAAAAVLVIGIYLNSRAFVAMLALPCSLFVIRVGSGGHQSNLAVADVFLFIGTIAAFSLMRWGRAGPLRHLLTLGAVYFAVTGLSVLDHPNRSDALEWVHEIFMVVGAMVVGFVIVDRGKAPAACKAFLWGSMVLAGWGIFLVLSHGGQAPYDATLGLDKNFMGDMLVVAVLLAHLRPPWTGLNGRWVTVVKYVALGGVFASQARQAIAGLVVAVVVVAIRQGVDRRQRVLLVAIIPLAYFAYSTVINEVHSGSSGGINSFTLRLGAYNVSLAIWRTSPILGVGERYWYNKALYPTAIQPPNAEVAALATVGVVGLIAFLLLIFGTLRELWRLPTAAASLGLAVLVAHFAEAQLDVFWVTATGSIPWIFVGMAVGAAQLEKLRAKPPPLEASLEAPIP